MILYVNGCSHTAAAEAVVPECFAVDDGKAGIDRRPHPTNFAASWCSVLSKELGFELVCDAESGGSNDRTIRTTCNWIENNSDKLKDLFVIIQWTTWEREEWLHNGKWYQVNASGWDWVPRELQTRYKEFVIDIDWDIKTQQSHEKIWNFHQWLDQLDIPHLFYNANSTFSDIAIRQDWPHCLSTSRYNWVTSYIDPYSKDHSYDAVLKNNGFEYANPKSLPFWCRWSLLLGAISVTIHQF